MDGADYVSGPLTIDEEVRVGSVRLSHWEGRERTLRARGRIEPISSRTVMMPEESVVIDERTDLSPAQAVENKLLSLLKEAALPLSQLQSRDLLRNRGSM